MEGITGSLGLSLVVPGDQLVELLEVKSFVVVGFVVDEDGV